MPWKPGVRVSIMTDLELDVTVQIEVPTLVSSQEKDIYCVTNVMGTNASYQSGVDSY